MKLSPYLNFDGRCEEALAFYGKILGGKVVRKMTYAETPMGKTMPPGWGDKICHVTYSFGDQTFGAADSPPTHYNQPQGITLTIDLADVPEAERVFKALSKEGTVQMPLQETFWADRFGIFTDRFGIPWMINCGKPA